MIGPAPSPALSKAAAVHSATRKELDAALMAFDAAVIRGDQTYLLAATDAAHIALQNHLDAASACWAVALRDVQSRGQEP